MGLGMYVIVVAWCQLLYLVLAVNSTWFRSSILMRSCFMYHLANMSDQKANSVLVDQIDQIDQIDHWESDRSDRSLGVR